MGDRQGHERTRDARRGARGGRTMPRWDGYSVHHRLMTRLPHFILVGMALATCPRTYDRDKSNQAPVDACFAQPQKIAKLSGTQPQVVQVRSRSTDPASSIHAVHTGVAIKVRSLSRGAAGVGSHLLRLVRKARLPSPFTRTTTGATFMEVRSRAQTRELPLSRS